MLLRLVSCNTSPFSFLFVDDSPCKLLSLKLGVSRLTSPLHQTAKASSDKAVMDQVVFVKEKQVGFFKRWVRVELNGNGLLGLSEASIRFLLAQLPDLLLCTD